MQLGSFRISTEEWRRRVGGGLCLYSGGSGHFLGTCLIGQKMSKVTPAPLLIYNQFFLSVDRSYAPISVFGLLDSGLVGNFLSSSLVKSLSIPIEKLASPVSIKALDGRPMSNSPVDYVTPLLRTSVHHVIQKNCNFTYYRTKTPLSSWGYPGYDYTILSLIGSRL